MKQGGGEELEERGDGGGGGGGQYFIVEEKNAQVPIYPYNSIDGFHSSCSPFSLDSLPALFPREFLT